MHAATAARRVPALAVVVGAHALALAFLLELTRTHPTGRSAEESLTLIALLPATRPQSPESPGRILPGLARRERDVAPPSETPALPSEPQRPRRARRRSIGLPRARTLPPAWRGARTTHTRRVHSGCLPRARCSILRLCEGRDSRGTTRALTGWRACRAASRSSTSMTTVRSRWFGSCRSSPVRWTRSRRAATCSTTCATRPSSATGRSDPLEPPHGGRSLSTGQRDVAAVRSAHHATQAFPGSRGSGLRGRTDGKRYPDRGGRRHTGSGIRQNGVSRFARAGGAALLESGSLRA